MAFCTQKALITHDETHIKAFSSGTDCREQPSLTMRGGISRTLRTPRLQTPENQALYADEHSIGLSDILFRTAKHILSACDTYCFATRNNMYRQHVDYQPSAQTYSEAIQQAIYAPASIILQMAYRRLFTARQYSIQRMIVHSKPRNPCNYDLHNKLPTAA